MDSYDDIPTELLPPLMDDEATVRSPSNVGVLVQGYLEGSETAIDDTRISDTLAGLEDDSGISWPPGENSLAYALADMEPTPKVVFPGAPFGPAPADPASSLLVFVIGVIGVVIVVLSAANAFIHLR